jgi:hypothetical protein
MPTRKTKSLSKKRIQQEPAFERTRENMSEFGRAGTANRLLRSALKDVLSNVADRYVSGRLTKRMMRIVQSDPVRERGQRIISPEALPILEGFNFNRNRSLSDAFYAPYEVHFKRATGLVTLSIPFFNATTMAETEAGATSYSLFGCAVAIDFARGQVEQARYQTDVIEDNDKDTRSIHITVSLPAGIFHPVIIVLGIEFYGNGAAQKRSVMDKAFNAMSVVKVFT